MKKRSTLGDVFFALFYGALIACAYLFGKYRGAKGGLDFLTYGAFATFLLHLFLFPKLTLAGLRQPKMCFRGLLWGFTQVFVFAAQSSGRTSSAFIASVMGSIFGILFGRILLKERLTGLGMCAALLAIAGVLVDPLLFKSAAIAIPGGFVQGLSLVMARSLMLGNKSIRQSISTSFFVGGFVGLVMMKINGVPFEIKDGLVADIAVVVLMLLVIQYSYFYLIKLFDSQKASIFLLTRVPWAFVFEAALFGAVISGSQILASLCIVSGSLTLLFERPIALLMQRKHKLYPKDW